MTLPLDMYDRMNWKRERLGKGSHIGGDPNNLRKRQQEPGVGSGRPNPKKEICVTYIVPISDLELIFAPTLPFPVPGSPISSTCVNSAHSS